ncbi:hypothetical protein KGB37_gp67 [Escherichia phage vB_EcoS Sa179lw]|uniref:Uncharacterized protein n=1 Tax=Escherichia phage vB_EcoS Sa179lw TaxID=2126819 RepID=A0A2P1MXG8_9CAUD|nr:hypothetical protein KGB37_gp67 [Escherichia phage vB_EcoS Sa179lw]AVP40252.1 hypothetical protein vBEcoSSa179w3YLVW_00067 [Escherichia phage vB_EcoS Sa179lw]
MKSNKVARRLLKLDHWESNNKKLRWFNDREAMRIGRDSNLWLPIITKQSNHAYFFGETK